MARYTSRILVGIWVLWVVAPSGYAADRLPVFVSIAPQKYFLQQIGKELVDIHIMVPPGADLHTYEPKPQQMIAVSKAKLYFAIGTAFEAVNLARIISINPQIKVVHTDQGIQKIPMAVRHRDGGGEDYAKGGAAHEGDHHEDNGLDPHIWLSPPLVMIQARTILLALQEADSANRAAYAENYQSFVAVLAGLDCELNNIFAEKRGLSFLVFHPSWGYFAHSYGLRQVSIEMEGKSPKPAQLKELIENARQSNIRFVFVQPQFSAKSAKLVAKEIGGEVAFIDPLAQNWLVNLREVAAKFEAALQ